MQVKEQYLYRFAVVSMKAPWGHVKKIIFAQFYCGFGESLLGAGQRIIFSSFCCGFNTGQKKFAPFSCCAFHESPLGTGKKNISTVLLWFRLGEGQENNICTVLLWFR